MSSFDVPGSEQQTFVLPADIGRYLDVTVIKEGEGFLVCRAYDMVGAADVRLMIVPTAAQEAVPDLALTGVLERMRALEHRHIVPVLDVALDKVDGFALLAMADHGKRRSPDAVPVSWISFLEGIGTPLLSAVAYAHAAEVTHGSLSLGHFGLGPGGRLQVDGFGMGELLSLAQPRGGWTVPTYQQDLGAFVDITARSVSGSGVDGPWQDGLRSGGCPAAVVELFQTVLDRSDSTLLNGEALQARLEDLVRPATRRLNQALAISVRPTHRALNEVVKATPSHVGPPELMIRDDLSGTVHVSRKRTSPEGSPDLMLNIYGNRFSYQAKVDEAVLALVAASPLAQDADFWRSGAWECDQPFEVAVRSRGSEENLHEMLASLTAFHEARTEGTARRNDRNFAEWQRQLEAKEALETYREQPIAYTEVSIDEHRVTFRLADDSGDAVLEQLVGEQRGARSEEGSRRPVNGQVVDVDDGTVVMSLDDPNAPVPASGELVVDTSASKRALERQREALQAVRFGNRGIVRPDLGDLLIEPGAASRSTPVEPERWFIPQLDEDKRSAVRGALATDDFFVVAGPPGTGKTQFIAELVAQKLEERPGARILLTSQTHVAVDNALERIRELLPEARLTRVGSDEHGKVAAAVRDLLLPSQLTLWREEVRTRGEHNLVEIVRSEGGDIDRIRAVALLADLMANADSVGRIQSAIDQAAEELAASDRVGDEQGRVLTETERAELEKQRAKHRKTLRDLRRERDLAVTALSALLGRPVGDLEALDADGLIELREQVLSGGDERRDLQALVSLQDKWLERVSSPTELEGAFLAGREVVAGTCLGIAALRSVRSMAFDLCIFDEASKATATETLVPLVRARRWVLVGDDRQLPPFQDDALFDPEFAATSTVTLDREELSRTLFSTLYSELPETNRTMLRTQYRMVPAIGDLISECFYGGELTTKERVRPAELGAAMPDPLVWIDSSGTGEHAESPAPSGRGFVNPAETVLVGSWLEQVDAALRRSGTESRFRVLVMSSYLQQVHALRRLAHAVQRDLHHLDLEVSTVDAVQGREADIVVFSVTRSNARNEWGFMKSDARINVALSRGRFGLVLVGDRQFALRGATEPLSRVARFIDLRGGDRDG